jgi:hypothetical protein
MSRGFLDGILLSGRNTFRQFLFGEFRLEEVNLLLSLNSTGKPYLPKTTGGTSIATNSRYSLSLRAICFSITFLNLPRLLLGPLDGLFRLGDARIAMGFGLNSRGRSLAPLRTF